MNLNPWLGLGLAALALGCNPKPEKTDVDGDGYTYDVDCMDWDASVHPGAEELCDGVDNDCDGTVDEEATDTPLWYPDDDGDGYGDTAGGTASCEQPSGYGAADGDCDDQDAHIHPGAREDDCTDPVDYNCDGSTGYADEDADGWPACEDCDDTVASMNPDADEVCNDLDDDCDGDVDELAVDAPTWYADADADGFGSAAITAEDCDQPEGYVANADDCDDLVMSTHPGAEELCDGVDNDCDGSTDEDGIDAPTWYADSDGDGFGDADVTTEACDEPSGYTDDATDCDDDDGDTYPSALETCDEVDNDCDGDVDNDPVDGSTWYLDADEDGYGTSSWSTSACDQPSGYVSDSSDCDDSSDDVSPEATEYCNDLDDDCDGEVDEDDAADVTTFYLDSDGDGAGDPDYTTEACDAPSGYVDNDLDCHPGNPAYVDCQWDGIVTFTPCGATGFTGPSQSDCDTEYTSTTLDGDVTVSSGIQEWVVPVAGTYEIAAYGAQGAAADTSYDGGLGAYILGEFELTEGELLYVAVGQEGTVSSGNGGGGGGSFVVDEAEDPMLIAGGGGGTRHSVLQDGCDGRAGEYGGEGSGSSQTSSCSAKTTLLGYGGEVSGGSWGSAGAGFYGDGELDYADYAGLSWANGLLGGYGGDCGDAYGGFGGGGNGSGCSGGGGGGGYSGGDGGRLAGGGGSYNDGTNQTNTAGANTGDGMVTIDFLED